MILFAALLVLAFILLQPITSSGKIEESPNCTEIMGKDQCPKEVREPLFAKLKETKGNMTYNCTLEEVSSVTASFGDPTAYLVLYTIDNLNQTVYKESNPGFIGSDRQNPLKDLNVTNFITNATIAWKDQLDKMGNKTQVGCYFNGRYIYELFCAFA
ncbi:hypothetical protein Y032_0283g1303 [Ancylostoma ceylanicum]|uniref:SCP domain-containing protein n=1 Tax=Ancylostoma ceylanicum TaxID=53326 RepID=A0A016S7F4_9BILA|nr:hypothetical protein Y032_0283g1303 [Ancylostoma ceylanicum]